MRRILLLGLGWLCLVLGAIGLVLPLLPTTPFLLAAAACFARGSPAWQRRLLAHPLVGPVILRWQRERSVAWRTKLVAIAALWILSSPGLLLAPPPWPLVMAGVGSAVCLVILALPTRVRR